MNWKKKKVLVEFYCEPQCLDCQNELSVCLGFSFNEQRGDLLTGNINISQNIFELLTSCFLLDLVSFNKKTFCEFQDRKLSYQKAS